jgi:hypothetical protein
MNHPLRALSRSLMDLGAEHPCWSQVSREFAALSDHCQLVAGLSESRQREAKMLLFIQVVLAIAEKGTLDDLRQACKNFQRDT